MTICVSTGRIISILAEVFPEHILDVASAVKDAKNLDSLRRGPVEDQEVAVAMDGEKSHFHRHPELDVVASSDAGHPRKLGAGGFRLTQEPDRPRRAALGLDEINGPIQVIESVLSLIDS